MFKITGQKAKPANSSENCKAFSEERFISKESITDCLPREPHRNYKLNRHKQKFEVKNHKDINGYRYQDLPEYNKKLSILKYYDDTFKPSICKVDHSISEELKQQVKEFITKSSSFFNSSYLKDKDEDMIANNILKKHFRSKDLNIIIEVLKNYNLSLIKTSEQAEKITEIIRKDLEGIAGIEPMTAFNDLLSSFSVTRPPSSPDFSQFDFGFSSTENMSDISISDLNAESKKQDFLTTYDPLEIDKETDVSNINEQSITMTGTDGDMSAKTSSCLHSAARLSNSSTELDILNVFKLPSDEERSFALNVKGYTKKMNKNLEMLKQDPFGEFRATTADDIKKVCDMLAPKYSHLRKEDIKDESIISLFKETKKCSDLLKSSRIQSKYYKNKTQKCSRFFSSKLPSVETDVSAYWKTTMSLFSLPRLLRQKTT